MTTGFRCSVPFYSSSVPVFILASSQFYLFIFYFVSFYILTIGFRCRVPFYCSSVPLFILASFRFLLIIYYLLLLSGFYLTSTFISVEPLASSILLRFFSVTDLRRVALSYAWLSNRHNNLQPTGRANILGQNAQWIAKCQIFIAQSALVHHLLSDIRISNMYT